MPPVQVSVRSAAISVRVEMWVPADMISAQRRPVVNVQVRYDGLLRRCRHSSCKQAAGGQAGKGDFVQFHTVPLHLGGSTADADNIPRL